jgi:hypothetical protein
VVTGADDVLPQRIDGHVIVTGVGGERIGEVERFEIDRTGSLKGLVVRMRESLGTWKKKRIAAEHIDAIEAGAVRIDVSATEVLILAEDADIQNDELWLDEAISGGVTA